MMAGCGCANGMKDGRPCGCSTCRQNRTVIPISYNFGTARERRGEWLHQRTGLQRVRKIDGQNFQMLPGSGYSDSKMDRGSVGPKSVMVKRANVLRTKGYNARVIPTAKGHTLWLSKKVRWSENELKTARNKLGANSPDFMHLLRQSGQQSRQYNKRLIPITESYKVKKGWDDEPGIIPFNDRYGKISISSGQKAQKRYNEMLETFWPAYWMSNSKHTDSMNEWVMHNDSDDPLYETSNGDLINSGHHLRSGTAAQNRVRLEEDLGEGAFMVKGTFEEAMNHLWDSESMEIDADAPEWVGDEYIKHMPTGRRITRQQLADGRISAFHHEGLGSSKNLTHPNFRNLATARLNVNSWESDIGGGYTADNDPTLPKKYELIDYMAKMPDEMAMFFMPELTDHTITGDKITTQYARLGQDSPSATYVSKEVIVGDSSTWIKPSDFGISYKIGGKKPYDDDSIIDRLTSKKYNHLTWFVPGTVKIADKNNNGMHDGVE